MKMKVNPEQSEKVQQRIFERGGKWASGDKYVKFTDQPYLFIRDAELSVADRLSFYEAQREEEVTPEEFLKNTMPPKEIIAQSFKLNARYKYIAADFSGAWWAYTEKPLKDSVSHQRSDGFVQVLRYAPPIQNPYWWLHCYELSTIRSYLDDLIDDYVDALKKEVYRKNATAENVQTSCPGLLIMNNAITSPIGRN